MESARRHPGVTSLVVGVVGVVVGALLSPGGDVTSSLVVQAAAIALAAVLYVVLRRAGPV